MTAGLRPVPPGDPSSLLDATRRSRDLEALAGGEVVDVLVVGGGITGVGVALDAASRGLTVALVEQGDLAAGTSRWSSKLVHGGMRYLASGQVGIAAESTRERGLLSTVIAPHLVRSLPFVTPLGTAGVGRAEGLAVRSAQNVADVLRRTCGTPAAVFPAPRRMEVAEALRLVPAVARSGLRAALVSWDGQLEDDARLVVAVARTAAAYGSRVLTRAAAVDVGTGGATVVDRVGGAVVDVRARHVVNATGVWAARFDPSVRLRPSRGTHLVLPSAALGHPTGALTVGVPGHFGRMLFALPQPDGLVYLGLTDEPADEPTLAPQATAAEVDMLLDVFSAGLERPLVRSDVIGVFAGLRPLLTPAGSAAPASTADLSRRHAVREQGGVITVVGGKLTTYRAMAEQVVDRLTAAPCVTARLPLVGAGPLHRDAALAVPARLVRRFGAEAPVVAALAADEPALLQPLADGVPALGVEVLWAAAAEAALGVDDVLDGRLRLDLVRARRALAEPAVTGLLGARPMVPAAAPVAE